MKIQTRQNKTYKSADLRGYFFSVRVQKFKFFSPKIYLRHSKLFSNTARFNREIKLK